MKIKKWEKPANFSGMDLSRYYCGVGRGQDSDVLSNSNFECLLDRLGGESFADPEDPAADLMVMVGHFGHWAVGWVEQILVHELATDKLDILQREMDDLEDYPVLDESHYSDAQCERQAEMFDLYVKDFIDEIVSYLGMTRPEKDSEQMLLCELASVLYSEACGYYGEDDAFVTARNIPTLVRNGSEFSRIEQNKYLIACIEKAQKVA